MAKETETPTGDEHCAEGFGHGMRLDFAYIVYDYAYAHGHTLKELAAILEIEEAAVRLLLHADWDLDTEMMGRVLHAIGIRARFVVPVR